MVLATPDRTRTLRDDGTATDSPALTWQLVEMAEIDRLVIVVTEAESRALGWRWE